MKLDLLKKLTALANNNPNENEANLAARKVCLMLAECKFNLKGETVVTKTAPDIPKSPEWAEPIFRSASNPTGPNPFEEFFRRHAETREPSWNRPPPYPNYDIPKEPSQTRENPFRSPFDNAFSFDLDDLIGKQVNVKIPRQDPKGFKESKFRSFDPVNNIIEADCILCQRWCRVTKVAFEDVKGCYVCPECEGKSK